MTTPNRLTGPDGKAYALRLTAADVNGIIAYFHWIPATRGYLAAYIRETYPGWSSNEFAEVFATHKVTRASSHGGPPSVRKDVLEVWISATLDCLVVRSGPSRKADPDRHPR